MRVPLSVCNSLATVRHILPIVLVSSCMAVIAKPIDSPRPIELPQAPERDLMSERGYSGLETWESRFQQDNDGQPLLRPFDRYRIEADESQVDRRSEFLARSGVTALAIVAPNEIGRESACKYHARNRCVVLQETLNEIIHGVLLGLAFAVPMFWLGNAGPWGGVKRPNVRAKRATTAGRQARAGENVLRTTGPGLVACRWRSA